MKLSDFENEKALDLIADMLEPVSVIMTDKDFVENVRNGNKLKAIKIALKNYQKEVIEILAYMEGVEPKEYHGNIITMTKGLLEIFNDEELATVFRSQGQEN